MKDPIPGHQSTESTMSRDLHFTMLAELKIINYFIIPSKKWGRSIYIIDRVNIDQCEIQKNWCTATVATTIEQYGGHTWTPAITRGETMCTGESASPAWLAAPAMNVRDTTKVYIWRLDTGCGPMLYRKCHSHNTQGKRHENTWVEPLAGNCTTISITIICAYAPYC